MSDTVTTTGNHNDHLVDSSNSGGNENGTLQSHCQQEGESHKQLTFNKITKNLNKKYISSKLYTHAQNGLRKASKRTNSRSSSARRTARPPDDIGNAQPNPRLCATVRTTVDHKRRVCQPAAAARFLVRRCRTVWLQRSPVRNGVLVSQWTGNGSRSSDEVCALFECDDDDINGSRALLEATFCHFVLFGQVGLMCFSLTRARLPTTAHTQSRCNKNRSHLLRSVWVESHTVHLVLG